MFFGVAEKRRDYELTVSLADQNKWFGMGPKWQKEKRYNTEQKTASSKITKFEKLEFHMGPKGVIQDKKDYDEAMRQQKLAQKVALHRKVGVDFPKISRRNLFKFSH